MSPRYGKLPLKVSFDAGASKAASGRTIKSYTWDFGDATPKKTGVKTSHTFTTAKYRTVKLTVVDSKGASASVTHTVDAGNTPPKANMTSPSSSLLFSAGTVLALRGTAADAEQGTLPTTSLTWDVVYNHGGAATQLLTSTTGNNLSVTVPQPADIGSAASSTIVITLTATDKNGLRSTMTKTLKPSLVTLNVAADPPSASIRVGNLSFAGTGSVRTWANSTVTVSALGGLASNGQPLDFSTWSDGGAATHSIVTKTSITLAANFVVSSANPYAPIADATVRDSTPDANDGASSILGVRSSGPKERTYLKFNVAGVSGAITFARLYLYAVSDSTNTPELYATNSAWTEAGITWATRPAPVGSVLPPGSGVNAGAWTIYDVTSAITGEGSYNFVLLRDSKTTAQFVSREGGDKSPRLMLTVAGSTDPGIVNPPQDLAGAPFSSDAIDLTWQPPSSTPGVVAYDIERDGELLTTIGPDLTYRDLGLTPKTTYSYRVRARTATGVSNWTPSVEVTTLAPTSSNIVTVKSATFVSEDPTVQDDYNAGTSLRVRGGSNYAYETYLKFKMPALSGPVWRAELQIFIPATPASDSGGSIALYGSGAWELGMVWSNRAPRHPVTPYDTATNLPAGDWVTLHPPDGSFGAGEVSYVLASNSNALTYIARSGATAPRLVIISFQGPAVVSSAPSPTPTAIVAPDNSATTTPSVTLTPAGATETPAEAETEISTRPADPTALPAATKEPAIEGSPTAVPPN
ncbi:MAG: DNRLRE domain-containing protein [Rhizobiales bacterium]|nr:DNRLRE domain-containing protein [Hyphomicrobiales bacterium]